MDIEKLVEDGARAICCDGKCRLPQDKCMQQILQPKCHAAFAIALAALERDAIAEQRFGRTAIFLDELIENYRTLATQLGAANEAR